MIYCFNDREQVGAEVAAWIKKYEGSSQIVTHPAQIEGGEGVKFFAYPPQGPEGEYVLSISEEINKQYPGIEIIPSLRVMRLHDKVIDQAMTFGQWMPSGWLFRNMDEVQKKINDVIFPVNSLSNSGDVRPLENPSEAYVDATECFNGNGFPLANGKRQTNYVYFQTILTDLAPSWRVFLFNLKYAIVCRMGDGKVYPMDVLSEQILELLKYAFAFMLDNNFKWGSVEVLAGSDRVREVRSPFIGSISTSWPKDWFLNGGMIFETSNGYEWESTGIPAIRWYQVVAKELVSGIQ